MRGFRLVFVESFGPLDDGDSGRRVEVLLDGVESDVVYFVESIKIDMNQFFGFFIV